MFTEMIIKRKDSVVTYVVRALILITGITFCAISFFSLQMFGPVLAIFIGWFCWVLWAKQYVEYEYSFINDEMDVDTIIGKRKRKRLATVNFRRIYILAKVESAHFAGYQNLPVIDASSQGDAKGCYFTVSDGEKGKFVLIFEPNERLLEAVIGAAGVKYREV